MNTLSAPHNQIVATPRGIGQLQMLVMLDLSHNKLEQVPSSRSRSRSRSSRSRSRRRRRRRRRHRRRSSSIRSPNPAIMLSP